VNCAGRALLAPSPALSLVSRGRRLVIGGIPRRRFRSIGLRFYMFFQGSLPKIPPLNSTSVRKCDRKLTSVEREI
ncbi:hypothetical protein SB861_61025, partial [Paraburkholderia sp. SIMBA_049]